MKESVLKILVCMKQVPQKDAPLKLNETAAWIREDVSYEVNEPDAFALEEALRQKEKHTGEVVVITSGPARAQQVEAPSELRGSAIDLGLMLHDVVYTEDDEGPLLESSGGRRVRADARFFHAVLRDGVLDVPRLVRDDEGRSA